MRWSLIIAFAFPYLSILHTFAARRSAGDMNITIDDTSPSAFEWISPGDTWITEHAGDPVTPQYFRGTFHGTHTDGDMMRFRFKGSQVWILGARRNNHGLYSVALDGGNPMYQLGYYDGIDLQAVLFEQGGLDPNVEHVVEITNLPSMTDPPGNATVEWWLDIDAVIINTGQTGRVYTTIVDDTSPLIQYSGDGWKNPPPPSPQFFYNTTLHATDDPGDSFSMKFNGSSIGVYGSLLDNHGNYTVSLDGDAQGNWNGSWHELAPGATLFQATSLKDGPHELLITNVGKGFKGNTFAFDYALFNSTKDPAAVAGSVGVNTTESTSGENADTTANGGGGSNIGAIAGGVAGGVVALLIIGALVWFFLRRKKGRTTTDYGSDISGTRMDLTGAEVKPYEDPNVGYTGYTDYPPAATLDSDEPSTPRRNQSSLPFLTAIPPPPASNATSYPHSINPPSSVGSPGRGGHDDHPMPAPYHHADPFRREGFGASVSLSPSSQHQQQSPNHLGAAFATAIPGISSVGSTTSSAPGSTAGGNNTASGDTSNTSHSTTKSPGVALPFTAHPPRALSDDTVDTIDTGGVTRLKRDGQETDYGPLGWLDDEGRQHVPNETLPPDYVQATEPMPGQRAGM